jgi:hypothetical protein
MPRHRQREFLRFLKQIDRQTPARIALHLIVDNYATPQPSPHFTRPRTFD